MSFPSEARGLVPSATSLPMIDPTARRLGRMSRVVRTAARLVADEVGPSYRSWFVTLTYRPEVEWEPKQVSKFLHRARKWHESHGVTMRYVWVLEKTQRGRPHYHCLFWIPKRLSFPKPDKQGWWEHGHSERKIARRPVGYIAKYATKALDAFKVKGARLYGVGGIGKRDRDTLAYWRLSKWLRERIPFGTRADRISFLGWVSRDTGELFSSPWAVVVIRGLLRLVAVGNQQQVFRSPSLSV